jgi:hypothetical protein
MITIFIIILSLLFVLAGISPLLVTADTQDLVRLEQ